jgi:hypothetical protein
MACYGDSFLLYVENLVEFNYVVGGRPNAEATILLSMGHTQ